MTVKKLYLGAILDLYDRRIIAYKIGNSNNNNLVFSTFDEAVHLNPDAHPIFHSDRGFQYTNKVFHQKIVDAGMIQSMSRVGRCIDNDPMEGWWGILKSEMYYLRKFTDKDELILAIEEYIRYYNTRRYQLKLNCMTRWNTMKRMLLDRMAVAVASTNCTDCFWSIHGMFFFCAVYLTGGVSVEMIWLSFFVVP